MPLKSAPSKSATRGTDRPTVLVIGKESVGKSTLISSLTRAAARDANFRGSTVTVESYRSDDFEFVDTPGIFRQSDTETTQQALDTLDQQETVLLVVQATQLDDDLAEMLPLVYRKQGAVAVTYWDKVQPGEAAMEALERLSLELGVPFIAVDSRTVSSNQRDQIAASLREPALFAKDRATARAGWRIEPKPGILEHKVAGPILAAGLLVLPTLATIFGANELANWLHPLVEDWLAPAVAHIQHSWPVWLRGIMTNTQDGFGYGLLDMGPFLLVWALPTVLLFSVILSVYKTTGLVERINIALHPWVRHVGLSGRDVVRVVMGFGCNVPAVVSTRSCSRCSRTTAVAAIAFGAACSYQLPATLAVLAVAAKNNGGSPFALTLALLAYLLITTLLYLRLTSPRAARDSLNILMTPSRPFMQWPTAGSLWRESWGTIRQFIRAALPIFILICVGASLLAQSGMISLSAIVLGPVMAGFHLPAETALPVLLASIRKDGIFLFASEGAEVPMTNVQVLTAVYLAGVLLPCLVTVLTMAKELGVRTALTTVGRQLFFAVIFALALGWGGYWLT